MKQAPLADMPQPAIVTSNDWHDYALIDSGNQRKLERFGKFHFIRPEPQAMWSPRLDEDKWKADGVFIASHSDADDGEGGGWKLQNSLPSDWLVSYQDLRFLPGRHHFAILGFFLNRRRIGTGVQTPSANARLPSLTHAHGY